MHLAASFRSGTHQMFCIPRFYTISSSSSRASLLAMEGKRVERLSCGAARLAAHSSTASCIAPCTTFDPSTPHLSSSSNRLTPSRVSRLSRLTLPLRGRTARVRFGRAVSSAARRSRMAVLPLPLVRVGSFELECAAAGVTRSNGGI